MDETAKIFDDMASEYDDLRDLWYSFLYSRLHNIIVKDIIFKEVYTNVLDVGCGTGFQSFLHGMFGHKVIGIDISKKLIDQANQKIKIWSNEKYPYILFPEYYPFVKNYNNFILETFRKLKPEKVTPEFLVGDAVNLPFKTHSFDHINCTGSVLSFIPTHLEALKEMYRVLKPGGTILIEMQSRWNFNAFWMIIDPILKNKLQINNSFSESRKILCTRYNKDVTIDYPFSEHERTVMLHVKLHSNSLFKKELKLLGFKIKMERSIHAITNLIPSSILDNTNPSSRLVKFFNLLVKLEEKSPIQLPACSKVFFCQKMKMK